MSSSSYVVASRAHLLARGKLALDIAIAALLYFSDAPTALVLAPALDALLLVPYLRYVSRSPALLTLISCTISVALLAAMPLALAASDFTAAGLALWVLLPLIPASAGFVLGRRKFIWQMAAVTLLAVTVVSAMLIRDQVTVTVDLIGVASLAVAVAASILIGSWLAARSLRADPNTTDLLGAPLIVAKGVIIMPFNWVVGGIQSETLRLELNSTRRSYNPRWVVLDLAPAGELGRRDLHAIERAAEDISTSHCVIVIARPPVDALGQLDMAQPVVGRIERFATVPQAVEAGLRRLGWNQDQEQGQRIVTRL